MGRPLRIGDPECFHHVVSRGNKGLHVFRDDDDRLTFLALVARVCERHGWQCHAYCLLGTHYHLLIELREPTLSRGMHLLNGSAARIYNAKYGAAGHVFERRFNDTPVETEAHMLSAARYIELNPVRAGICVRPGDWRWSSFRANVGDALRPPFLSLTVAQALASRLDVGRAAWRGYVESEQDALRP